MTLLEVLAAADERVVGLAPWTWRCWGTNAVFMALGTESEDWASCVFDAETMAVYALETRRPEGGVLRWVDPDWREAWRTEAKLTGTDLEVADGEPVTDTTETEVLIALNLIKEQQ